MLTAISTRLRYWHKLAIVFLLAIVLPVIALSVINYRLARHAMIERELHMLDTTVQSIAGDIDKYLMADQRIVQYISGFEHPRVFLSLRVPDAAAIATINAWLREQKELSSNIRALFLLTPDGKCAASTDPRFLGQSYSIRRYFREAINGRYYRSDWSVGLVTGEPGIFISVPIGDKNALAGVLVLKMDVHHIGEILQRWSGHERDFFLVNHAGVILYHSNASMIYRSLAPLPPETLRDIEEDRQFADHRIESLGIPQVLLACRKARPGTRAEFVTYTLQGQDKVAMLARLNEQNWTVGVALREEVIQDATWGILRNTVFLSLLVILIGFAASLLIARAITRPLRRLTETVDRFAAGEHAIRSTESRTDELGLLSNSFNTMASTIATHTEGLEQRVHDRTAELERLSTILKEELDLQQSTAEALRKSEERFRRIAENVNAVIWALDAATLRPTYIGPYVQTLRGFTVEEAMTQTLSESLTLDSFRKVMALAKLNIEHLADPGKPFVIPPLELEQRCKDGGTVFTEMKVSVIRDRNGIVREFIGISWDISARKAEERRLAYESQHDTLTGLHNRAYFEAKLADPRARFPISLLMVDLDGLKFVNDTMGHDAGDRMLQGAASILQAAIREGDTLARIGGDEFAILLYGMDADMVAKAITRIRTVEAHYNETHPDLPVHISIGAATALSASEIPEAYHDADAAMYADKRSHRSRPSRDSDIYRLTPDA